MAEAKGKPFVMIGIITDTEARDVLKMKLEKDGIEYPNVISGSTQHGVAGEWKIHSYPTLFVIDAQGVIRYRGHDHEAAKKIVSELLAKASSGAPAEPKKAK